MPKIHHKINFSLPGGDFIDCHKKRIHRDKLLNCNAHTCIVCKYSPIFQGQLRLKILDTTLGGFAISK